MSSNFLKEMRKMRLSVQSRVSTKAPVRSGKLKRNGKCSKVVTEKGKVSFDWMNNTFYAGFVIYGTGRGNRLKKAYNPAYEGKGQKPNLYPYIVIGKVIEKFKPKLAKAAGQDAANIIVKSLSFLD